MSTYEPETVAIATVRGVPNVLVIRDDRQDAWLSSAVIGGFQFHVRTQVADIRPLVVLDLADPGSHVTALREYAPSDSWGCLSCLADQIEAQTKPPRIPEPGWSGVVEAHTAQNSDRLRWQRDSGSHSEHWVCQDTLEYDRPWDDLIDPTLVRPGIGDES